ncbi:PEP_CTERM-anchored TLD domain-containing protein [uncultured Roseibium sp.]|uniref:PEP_CTERM-anchored TLD domain-containing protein n=1 Tax=uncultured Roseibium sp. TaxID=1936171 RepID=UPI0026195B7B|nr:PEP_CTERM-anchored TLD domain-containing protein [uncultured Roseibium sp.]
MVGDAAALATTHNLTSAGVAVEYELTGDATSGYTLAATAGLESVFTLVVLADGTYTFTLEGQIDHGTASDPATPADEETLTLDFSSLLRAEDADGDTIAISASRFQIEIIDDVPVTSDVVSITVDEDDIFNLQSQGNNPADGDADGSTTGGLDVFGPAFASGSIASTVSFGADGAAASDGFAFAADAATTMEALGLSSNGEALSFTVTTVGGATFLVGYVDNGNGVFNLFADRPVISLQLNAEGDYIARLHDQLDHVAGNGEDAELVAGAGSLDEIDFGAVIEATDGDGDTIGLAGQFLVSVTDDVPEPDIWVDDYVRIDETYGDHSDNVFNETTGQYNPNVVALFAGVTNPGSDADLIGEIYARFDVVDYDVNVGTDETATRELELRIDDADSGLFTTEDEAITLTLEDGLVIGRIASGEAVFAIHIDLRGRVSIVQYQSLKHPDTTSSDEHIDLAGKISAVLTITDADGDEVSTDVSIGADVTFDDDGPTAFRNGSNIGLDEATQLGDTISGQLQFDGGADGATVTDVSFFARNNGNLRALDVEESGSDRRIDLTSGGESITTNTSTDPSGVITVTGIIASTGATAFTLVVQPDGNYTYVQDVAFDHPDADETGVDDPIALRLNFTVTDGDGDTDESSALIFVEDDGPDALWAGSHIAGDEATQLNTPIAGTLQFDPGVDGATVTEATMGSRGVYVNRFDQEEPAGSQRAELSVGGELVTSTSTTDAGTGVITINGVTETSGTPVFQIIVQPDGSYSYEQFVGFDHPDAGETGADDVIALRIDFTVTDGDGDTDSAGAYIRISDDGVAITAPSMETVFEDGTTALTGVSLDVDWGVDDANPTDGAGSADRSVSFASATAETNVTVSEPGGTLSTATLTSNGNDVDFVLFGTVLIGYTGTAPADAADLTNAVFTVTLSDDDPAGSYDFTLLQPLDHAAPSGTDHYIDLAFAFNATDSDGDVSADSSFTVRVDAAGTISSIDYSALTTGVFVNLSDDSETIDSQTVAADTSTDRTGQGPVVGIDSVAGVDDATGGSEADILVGGDENNELIGGAGDDTLKGGAGTDILRGGDDTDTAVFTGSVLDYYFEPYGNGETRVTDTRPSGDGVTRLFEVEKLQFSEGTYTLVRGGNGNNTLTAPDGEPHLVLGFQGSDTLTGGAESDVLIGDNSIDSTWQAGNDILDGRGGDDIVLGGGGDDTIIWRVGDGNDEIDGGANTVVGDTLNVFSTAAGQTITLDAPGDDNDGFTVISNGETVDVDDVEEVSVDFSAGSGTLNVTNDFVNSGINVNTITVEGGDDADIVDASAMTGTDPDSKVGIDFNGNGGDDIFKSGVGDDTFTGGETGETVGDTIVLSGNLDTYTLTLVKDANGFVIDISQVADNGSNNTGTDSVSEIEVFSFADGDLDLTAPVQLFDVSGNLVATFGTIQAAVNASAARSTTDDVIRLSEGTYAEDVTVGHAVSILGPNTGKAWDDGSRSNEAVIDGEMTISAPSGTVVIDGVTIENNSGTGVSFTGISIEGDANVTVENTIFDAPSTTANSNGDRAIDVVTGADGTITVDESSFGGSKSGHYGSNWNFAVSSSSTGAEFIITNNDFSSVTYAVILASFNDDGSSAISGNTLTRVGYGVRIDSIVGDSELTSITNNEFVNVINDFVLSNVSTDIDFDLDATNNSSPDTLKVVTGSGNDEITGTSGNDDLRGNDGDDTFIMKNGFGDDSVDGGSGGTDSDTLDMSAVTSDLTFDGRPTTVTDGVDTISYQEIESVISGDGNDLFTDRYLGTDITSVSMGGGNDTFNWWIERGRSLDVDAGTGNDTVRIGADTGAGSTGLFNGTVDGGDDTDTLQFGVMKDGGTGFAVTFTGDNSGTVHSIGGEAHITNFENFEIFNLFRNPWWGTDDIIDASASSANLTINANSGNDIVISGLGDDILDGGRQNSGDNDTVSYEGATSAVTANLETGTATGGGGTDTLSNFENLTGSALGDDLTGDGNGNIIVGLGGDDDITGAAGSDTLFGNDTDLTNSTNVLAQAGESDTAIYSGTASDYSVTLESDGSYLVTHIVSGDVDTLYGIEGIDFGGDGVDFDLSANVLVFDASGNLIGTFGTITEGVTAADPGFTVQVNAGTYEETFTIGEGITIIGANAGIPGTGTRGAETVIDGLVTLNGTGAITIDGVQFLNNEPVGARGQLDLVTVASGAGHTIENSVFLSTVVGGDTGGIHDVALMINTLVTGSVTIQNNLFTGDSSFDDGDKYTTAAWGRGIWSNGGGIATTIDDNTFQNTRTGVNLDGYQNGASSVDGNTFVDAGSGISVGNGSTPANIDNNSFTNVDTDFNLRNLTNDITFDLAGNTAPDGIVVLGGSGNDDVTGNASVEFFDGRGFSDPSGNDRFEGKGGDDIVFARDGDDTAVFNDVLAASDVARVYGVDLGSYGIHDGWQVTTATEGTDTLFGVEIIEHADGQILLVGNGGFATIADAVAAANSGDTILIAEGTWSGAGNVNVTIDKPLTIIGAGNGSTAGDTILDGGGFILDMAADYPSGSVTIQDLAVANAGTGILAQDQEILGTLTIDGVRVEDSTGNGILVSGRKASAAYDQAGVQNVVITNSDFIDNGQSAANVANIMLFEFDGNLTLTNVDALNAVTGTNSAAYGVQIAGFDGPLYDQKAPASGSSEYSYDVLTPLGTVTIDDLTVEGATRKASFYIQGFTDTSGLNITNSTVDTISGWDKPVIIDPMSDQLPTGTPNTPGNGGSFFDETSANGSYDLSGLTVVQNGSQFSQLDGTTKVDVITGTQTVDLIAGFEGDDTLNGGAGNDFVFGGAGNDTVIGGSGNDTIVWSVGDGTDVVQGAADGTEADTDTDTFYVNGSGGGETFLVETRDAYDLRTGNGASLASGTEIVVSRSDGTLPVTYEVVGELENIDDIVINGTAATPTSSGTNVTVSGDFTNTDLDTSTITLNGSQGDDTIDVTDFAATGHKIVFVTNGGQDIVTGARSVDLIDVQGRTPQAVEDLGSGGYKVTFVDGTSVTFTGDPTFVEDANAETPVVVNLPPVAEDDTATTDEDTAVSVSAAEGLLANDSDLDGGTLAITEIDGNAYTLGTEITLASGALLTVYADGSYDYDPNGQFEDLNDTESDTDSFSYTLSDGQGGTATGTATVTVEGVTDNLPPTLQDGTMRTTEEGNFETDFDTSGILGAVNADLLALHLGENSLELTNIYTKQSGDVSTDWHAAVDNMGATITVLELDNGNIIGGYNPFSWNSSQGYNRQHDTAAFLFNLSNETVYEHSRYDYVTYNTSSYGPTFGGGHDLHVQSNLVNGYANIGHTYGDVSSYGTNDYRVEFSGSYNSWQITQMETFTVGTGSAPAIATLDLSTLGDDPDPDDTGATLTYTIEGHPAKGVASISGTTLSFDPDGDFDDLADGETEDVTIRIRATDSYGAYVESTVTVTVDGLNDAPEFSGLVDAPVTENIAGAVIDEFEVTDDSSADGLTFRVLNGNGVDSRFEVVAKDGTVQGEPGTYQLRLKSGVSLDYEAENSDGDPTIDLTIETNDGQAFGVRDTPVTVTVRDAIEVSVGETDVDTSTATAGTNAPSVSSTMNGGNGGPGDSGRDAEALQQNEVQAGTNDIDHTTVSASAQGQNGGRGGNGADGGYANLNYTQTGGNGSSTDPYLRTRDYNDNAGDGGNGGAGGAGGSAVAEVSDNEVYGLNGDDRLVLQADALGGYGGVGGSGAYAGYHGPSGTSYDTYRSSSTWGGSRTNYQVNSYSPGEAADSGSGGDGGASGYASAIVENNTVDGGIGNDFVEIAATAVSQAGASGGQSGRTRGGINGDSATPGDSGDGGDAGNAAATIIGNSLSGDDGDDTIQIVVDVSAGNGGQGGNSYSSSTQHYLGTDVGVAGRFDPNGGDRTNYYGPAGDGGDGGNGGNASVVIDGNTLNGGADNDTIRIALALAAGSAGAGGISNAGSTSGPSTWNGYTSYNDAGPVGANGVAGLAGTENLSITDNELLGESGDDLIEISTGSVAPGGTFDISGNLIDGGADNDTLDLSGVDRAINIDLGAETLTVNGGGSNTVTSIEKVVGTAYGDTITGSSGNDELLGGNGADIIDGAGGDDLIAGGLGSDQLTGGTGADTFVLTSLAEADIITDYTYDDGDKIDLGTLLDTAFSSGETAADLVRATEGVGGEITVEVDVDGTGTANTWQEAATLQDHASMGDTVRVVMDTSGTEVDVAINNVA